MSLPKVASPAPGFTRVGKAGGRNSYADHVNPQWVRLLSLLNMNVRYVRCTGAELFTQNGDRILDFLSGYCVHNLGHNHPAVISALHVELDENGPAMLQSHVPESAGDLAAELCRRAGGRLNKAYFCSSGSEGIETVIKFARMHTRRSGLLYCQGAFHGLTCGRFHSWPIPPGPRGLLPCCPEPKAFPLTTLRNLSAGWLKDNLPPSSLSPSSQKLGCVSPLNTI